MREMTYRPADLADIPALAGLRTEGEEGGASAVRMARYLTGEHHPQQALLPRVLYLAAGGEALAGYIAGHLTRRYGCDGELQWLYVIPERRGSGVAAALLRRLAGWFAAQNAMRVCVNVAPSNTAAQRFYTRHGAEPLNEHWLVWTDLPAALGER